MVFNRQISKKCHEIAGQVRSEFVLKVTGEVALRPAGTENLKLPSGEIEVIVSEAEILNTSKTPPFYINEDSDVDENVRLKFRYLDLRRERMLKNLILRDNVVRFMRDFFHDKGFLDVETPILVKSTPEGARDYLVSGSVLCSTAIASAVKTIADGGWNREIFPDCQMLPR